MALLLPWPYLPYLLSCQREAGHASLLSKKSVTAVMSAVQHYSLLVQKHDDNILLLLEVGSNQMLEHPLHCIILLLLFQGHEMAVSPDTKYFPADWLGVEVSGATLGILGMGTIGYKVAERAKAFEMKILYHNRNQR